MATKDWKKLVAEKRLQQQAAIPKEWILTDLPSKDVLNIVDFPEKCGLLTPLDIEITKSNVGTLLDRLAKGTWSSVVVTTAFSKRAIIAHQLVNCLTEIFIDRALARAAELDKHLETTGQVVGPLHGLPISLKDQISIKDLDSTMGYVSRIGKPAAKNSVLADILQSCGAVLYVKTNVPQTLMWPETFNHVFGRTSNPYNRALTCGGSSGGEGALIALKGSPLGVGSDVGGSIRIPAGFNGLYGLRPSYGRVPYAGCVNSLEGQDSLLSVLGPMSNSLDGLKRFMKCVLDEQPWLRDPLVVRKGWSEEEFEHGGGKQLCFAILWDDRVVLPHPPVIRGLEETKKALLAAGHNVIDWTPLSHKEIYEVTEAIWAAGSAEDYRVTAAPSGEPVIMSLEVEDPALADKHTSTYRNSTEGEYLDHWNATVSQTGTGRPVDAIISPMAPFTAPPHGLNKNPNYTMIWNSLDYTSLVLPTCLYVNESIDVKKPPHSFHNELDKANYELYDPKVFKAAPITIQVIGRTLEEEGVIAMGEIVDSALKANLCRRKGPKL